MNKHGHLAVCWLAIWMAASISTAHSQTLDELSRYFFVPTSDDRAVITTRTCLRWWDPNYPFGIDDDGRGFPSTRDALPLNFPGLTICTPRVGTLWTPKARSGKPQIATVSGPCDPPKLPGGPLNCYGRCEAPIVELPVGQAADFFGLGWRDRGDVSRVVAIARNTVHCQPGLYLTPTGVESMESRWQAEFLAPRVLTFGGGVRAEAIEVRVVRYRVALPGGGFSAGDEGLWMTYWFARGLGFFQSVPGPMYPNFGLLGALSMGGAVPSDDRIELQPEVLFNSVPARRPTLPPVPPEATAVEYRNTLDFPASPGGQFFYSTDPAEQAFVDSGAAGRWVRTGRSFAVGGYVPVCRFYGSVSPGPNSHFYTADPDECRGVKSLELKPRPADRPQWNSEGVAYYAVLPALNPATQRLECLPSTVPVYRAYNNAFADGRKNPWDSNHRYSTDRTDIEDMVRLHGWRDEGMVFCVPAGK